MSPLHQKKTGTDFTPTIAGLSLALIFVPAAMMVSQPLSEVSVLPVLAGSVLCIGLSGFVWHKYSRLTIPSLSPAPGWWK